MKIKLSAEELAILVALTGGTSTKFSLDMLEVNRYVNEKHKNFEKILDEDLAYNLYLKLLNKYKKASSKEETRSV